MTPPAPRHVLFTADAVGGVWTYALDLAGALAEAGTAVTLAVLGPPPGAAQREAAVAIDGLKLVETDLPLDWIENDPERLAAAGRSLAALAATSGADLVHLNSPALATGVRFPVPVVGGCHSCLASWWSAVKGDEPMPEAFRWRSDLLTRGYAACDRLIAPSYAFMQATAALYGAVPETVHNGRAAPPAATAPRRDQVGLTSGRLWDEGKNLRTLDRAAGRMRHPVRAAGSLAGPDGPAAAPDHLVWLGRLEAADMRRELERATVFASLSLYEPFGLGVLEAAQAGCALVLSDIPTFRELWQGAAIFVPADDEATIARVLDDLLDDPAAAAALGAAAAARAERFTVAAMAEGTLRVYARAVAARAPMSEAAA